MDKKQIRLFKYSTLQELIGEAKTRMTIKDGPDIELWEQIFDILTAKQSVTRERYHITPDPDDPGWKEPRFGEFGIPFQCLHNTSDKIILSSKDCGYSDLGMIGECLTEITRVVVADIDFSDKGHILKADVSELTPCTYVDVEKSAELWVYCT